MITRACACDDVAPVTCHSPGAYESRVCSAALSVALPQHLEPQPFCQTPAPPLSRCPPLLLLALLYVSIENSVCTYFVV